MHHPTLNVFKAMGRKYHQLSEKVSYFFNLSNYNSNKKKSGNFQYESDNQRKQLFLNIYSGSLTWSNSLVKWNWQYSARVLKIFTYSDDYFDQDMKIRTFYTWRWLSQNYFNRKMKERKQEAGEEKERGRGRGRREIRKTGRREGRSSKEGKKGKSQE